MSCHDWNTIRPVSYTSVLILNIHGKVKVSNIMPEACFIRTRFLSLDQSKLRVNSDYAQPISGQVTEAIWPVIGRAQPELTPSKRQKTDLGHQQPYNWLYEIGMSSSPVYNLSVKEWCKCKYHRILLKAISHGEVQQDVSYCIETLFYSLLIYNAI